MAAKDRQYRLLKNITKYLLLIVFFAIVLWMNLNAGVVGTASSEGAQQRAVAVSVLYIIIVYLFLVVFEAFNIEQRRILDLIYGHLLSAICANIFFIILMMVVATGVSPKYIWIEYLKLMLIECVAGIIWSCIFFRVYIKGQCSQEALFVYGNREDRKTYVKTNNQINTYFKITKAVSYKEKISKIMKIAESFPVVFLGDIPYEERNTILKLCMQSKKSCYSIPKVSDIYIQNTDVLQLHDKMILRYRENGITAEKRMVKRGLDILMALLMLAVASPFMAVIAICIKLEDGGDVLYRQVRVTEGGREFQMYKFRSMRMDAEKDGAHLARVNDERITRVGYIIRNIHFDELPQLINILKGDMSVVGPRPERKEFIDMYTEVIPEFSERLKVKAGLTGYAQVYGKYNSTPEDKIKYDLMYIYNYSLRLDLKLILLTARILFQKENTEGIDSDQISAIKKQVKKEGTVPYEKSKGISDHSRI